MIMGIVDCHVSWLEGCRLPLGAAACIASFFVMKSYVSPMVKRYHFDKVRNQKKDILRVKKEAWYQKATQQISAEDSRRVTGKNFEELLEDMHCGKLDPITTLHAFQRRAAEIDHQLNFVAEPIKEAEGWANELGALSEADRRKKPLFGIPISVKENYFLEGYDVTAGCVQRIGEPVNEHAVLVQALIDMGAVPFIRTNLSHTCLAIGSSNPIYGLSRNPHNQERSCGGSSSGEGAAVATRSSVLGFGTDTGGSVRIPAAWNGCYSLRPTAGRLSDHGFFGVDINERIVTITLGPFAQEVKSLVAVMKGFSSPTTLTKDLYVPPVPFNNEELNSSRKLRIGYFYQLDIVQSSQSAKRALDISIEALRTVGHELVEWNPPDATNVILNLFLKNLFGDGGQLLLRSLEGDRPSGHLEETVRASQKPHWLFRFFAFLLSPLFPNLLNDSECSVAEFWCMEHEIKEYRYKVIKEMEREGIDVIIAPAMPVPAMRIGEALLSAGVFYYLGWMNLVNFPSGIVPVTKVTSDDLETDKKQFPVKDARHKAMKAVKEMDLHFHPQHRLFVSTMNTFLNKKDKNLPGSEGLPMAVQVCSFPYHDERCLRVMSELESKVQYQL